jgi:hypothetical protein
MRKTRAFNPVTQERYQDKHLQESMSNQNQKLNLERLDLTSRRQGPTHGGEKPAAELYGED